MRLGYWPVFGQAKLQQIPRPLRKRFEQLWEMPASAGPAFGLSCASRSAPAHGRIRPAFRQGVFGEPRSIVHPFRMTSSRDELNLEPVDDSYRHRVRSSVRDFCARQRGIRIDFEADREQRQYKHDDQGSHGPAGSGGMRQDQPRKPAKNGRFIAKM
jgi:hypothetical protein